MARRIKSNKRKHYGNRTFGGGNTKNRRGKGNKGGVGRAGWHKHKWLKTIKEGGMNKRTRGEKGFRNPAKKAYSTVTLGELAKQITAGKHQKNEQGLYTISLPKMKVLSNGAFTEKARVHAAAFSAKAAEKIKAAGGETSTS